MTKELDLNEGQVESLRHQAEDLLSSERGQRVIRELLALRGAFHGVPMIPVNTGDPHEEWYRGGDYFDNPERFAIDYYEGFYLYGGGIDRLETADRFYHRNVLESKIASEVPNFEERLQSGQLTVLDGDIVIVEDSEVKFFVPAMDLEAYTDKTIALAANRLASKGYLLLFFWEDNEWREEELNKPELAEYLAFKKMEAEEADQFRKTTQFKQKMRWPTRRYNWELVVPD